MRSIFLFLVCILLTGCLSTKKQTPKYNKPVVIGERIFIVEPGTTTEIPPLVSPAKKWYLVDNVGLQAWLGIPSDL